MEGYGMKERKSVAWRVNRWVKGLRRGIPEPIPASRRTFLPLTFDDDERVEESDLGDDEDDYELDPAKVWEFDPRRH